MSTAFDRAWTVAVAAGLAAIIAQTVAPAAIAHADGVFQSPSGNIACMVTSVGRGRAVCEISGHSYASPPRPSDCHLAGWGDHILMEHGSAPVWMCHGDALLADGQPTLQYGETGLGGTIACGSEVDGVTCTDTSTGHFFTVSREAYQFG